MLNSCHNPCMLPTYACNEASCKETDMVACKASDQGAHHKRQAVGNLRQTARSAQQQGRQSGSDLCMS